jgi:hypothetical protein
MILALIRITLWNRLTYLLKYFRFNKNEKKMNHNHLKHLFSVSSLQYKNLKYFKPIYLWNISKFSLLKPFQMIKPESEMFF